MSIKTYITDPSTGRQALVDHKDTCDCNALVVATMPHIQYENKISSFVSDNYGVDMNQNALITGDADNIHNGTDTILWTASDIIGGIKTVFNKNAAHSYNGIITVVNYAIIDPTDSFTINGITRLNITHWVAETSNDVTATNIASDITNNVTGFSAVAVGAVVTVTANSEYDITSFSTNADIGEMTASGKSIEIDNEAVGSVFQFTRTVAIDTSNYVVLKMKVYVDKDWAAGDDIVVYGYDTNTGLQVGTSVGLQNYFNYNVFGKWHDITIPLSDMGDLVAYPTLDAFRFNIVTSEVKSPKFYLDQIQLIETSTIQEAVFYLRPNLGTWLHVSSFTISLAAPYTGIITVAGATENATFQGIPYDSLLGVILENGIRYTRIQNEIVKESIIVKNLIGFLQLPSSRIVSHGGDGINSWLALEILFAEPIILKSEGNDVLKFIMSDDLSDLLHFRIFANAKVQQK